MNRAELDARTIIDLRKRLAWANLLLSRVCESKESLPPDLANWWETYQEEIKKNNFFIKTVKESY